MATRVQPDLAARVRGLIESGEARARRERAGLTLRDAAAACGDVYPSAVLLWESGRRFPRARNIRAYARFLDKLGAA
jgi:transcriptional regulator with XRE-family HTH domain